MSAFSTQSNSAKPAKNLEMATDDEVAARLSGVGLSVKSDRTIRRYKRDPRARKILGVVAQNKQCRIPKQQDWAKIARELQSFGKASHASPGRTFKREMGWGNPRRHRDAKILRLALELQRRKRKQRLSKQLPGQLEKVGKMAQIIAAKYRCRTFNAPKFFRKHLEAANEKRRKHNAPQIEWLRRCGLWDQAKTLIKKGEGEANFHVVETFKRKGKDISIPHRINIRSVETKAQLRRRVRQLTKLWPSPEAIKAATVEYNYIWWQFDLERAGKLLRQKKKTPTVNNLLPLLYRDETAKQEKDPGISRSSYFRRRYTKADLAHVRRVKTWSDERRLPHRKFGAINDGLGSDDLKGMTIQTAEGWELRNPYRDNSED